MKTYPKFLFALAIASLLLVSCGSGLEATPTPVADDAANSDVLITATGVAVPEKWAALSPHVPGAVDEVLVKEGERVSAGQALVRLDGQAAAGLQLNAAQQAYDTILRNEDGERARLWLAYMDAQKVRETAQKKWNDINVNDIENRIEDRQKDVEDRQADLAQAQETFDNYKSLGKDDSKYKNARRELDDAQAEYDEAVKRLESTMRERDVPHANLDAALAAEAEAKYQYERTLDGAHADQLALAKSRLDAAQEAFDAYVVTAPFKGVVCNLNVRVGEWVMPGMPILQLGDLASLRVETTDLSEIDAARVHADDVVSVTFDALPDVVVKGKVLWVANKSAEGSGVNYTAVVGLDSVPGGLRWGMTAFVDIEVSP